MGPALPRRRPQHDRGPGPPLSVRRRSSAPSRRAWGASASGSRWRSTPSRELWHAYGCRGWPSLFLWSLGGALSWFHFGEGEYLGTEEATQAELREIDALRELPAPMEPLRATDGPGARVLAPTPEVFPGGSWERPWTAGEDGEELAVEYEAGGAYATVEGKGAIEVELDGARRAPIDGRRPGAVPARRARAPRDPRRRPPPHPGHADLVDRLRRGRARAMTPGAVARRYRAAAGGLFDPGELSFEPLELFLLQRRAFVSLEGEVPLSSGSVFRSYISHWAVLPLTSWYLASFQRPSRMLTMWLGGFG